MSYRKIIDEIIKRRSPNDTFITGIDGAGGAGKSTVAGQLENELKSLGYDTAVFHIDDFIHPKAVRYNDAYPQWEQYYYLQWRYEYFMQEVVVPIKSGAQLRLIELYDKENDSYRICSFDVPKGSIVIAEGVFLLRRELSDVFDLKVYVDVSREERLERVLKRDGYIGDSEAIRKKYTERYFPAEEHYFAENLPMHQADIII